ncbi:MAG: hypothetical protein HQL73_02830 [Magnetococcales bacterium]|nr:hypothetical protein [Magnetococcales bacterium]
MSETAYDERLRLQEDRQRAFDALLQTVIESISRLRVEIIEQISALRGESREKFGVICEKIDRLEKQHSEIQNTLDEHGQRITDLEQYRAEHTSQVRLVLWVGGVAIAAAVWIADKFFAVYLK